MANYFIDTSALAKLYHQEAGSDFLAALIAQPSARRLISRLSLVEMESVFAIKVRTGELDATGREYARRRLRADVSQNRILVGPRIEDRHYQTARRQL